MSTPKHWPPSLPYLQAPLHDGLTPAQLRTLRQKPPPGLPMSIIPASETGIIPPRHVRIQPITQPAHPAHGQHGLFAARHLPPGSFILAYLGRVHGSATTDPTSDYDLWLDKEADLAVDAARGGNEGRYVNDFRGVRERANAVFGTGWSERWGEVCVGVWVVGGKTGIRKGDEIVVSYGKGFWGQRQEGGDGGGW
ncbi:hypothetical protein E4U54_007536 [Claviceps lovelessii]|nr:hypothetical protein E4U54_007536 [Claviceps lovelessii]